MQKKGFTLVELLVVIGILGVLMASLFPAISGAIATSNLTACQSNGIKLFTELNRVEQSRGSIGLGSIYPMTPSSESSDSDDIADKDFNNAEDYFNALFDMQNAGGNNWKPYTDKGFEMSTLWGFKVNGPRPGQKLTKNNIIWAIAKDMTDSAPAIMPLLVTRNVNCKELRSGYTTQSSATIGLGTKGSSQFDTPFGDQGCIIITKGGKGIKIDNENNARLSVIYTQTFPSVDENSENKLVYLIPGGKETPKSN